MRYGIVILPQDPWPESRRKWVLAEELGFDHAWTYDHLSWRSLADEPWCATIPLLTAAATATTRIRLGTFVASPNYRHPVPFAKDLATLDDISGGRFTLGVGSGGTGFDAFVLGQEELTPRQRHERFAEFVTVLDELLRFENAGSHGISASGDWYTAHEARMVGAPAQVPRMPFMLAANGPKGLALMARFGQSWVTTGAEGATGEDWWRSVGDLSHRLDDAAEAAGRDPLSIGRVLSLDNPQMFSLSSIAAFEEMTGRAADLGFTDVISHWPRRDGIYAGSEDVLVEAAALIRSA
ncbi:LLM class flavin-dependent oxidoreductase [Herbiconiux sp. P17]|uniref:LLM class flavin-dependent oxidoreductase n=1 Tax=Herbiconiux wuyangfengii TaxID=3342794 RepID=UPI0035B796CC